MADQEHTNNPLLCLLTIIGCFFIQCWQRILQEFSSLILQRLLALPQHPNVEIFLHQSNAHAGPRMCILFFERYFCLTIMHGDLARMYRGYTGYGLRVST